jgi:hypothetical protein
VRQTREVTVYVFHLMKTPSGRQALAHLTKERKLQKKKSDARIGGPRSEFHRFPPISTACIQVRTGVGFRAELNAER